MCVCGCVCAVVLSKCTLIYLCLICDIKIIQNTSKIGSKNLHLNPGIRVGFPRRKETGLYQIFQQLLGPPGPLRLENFLHHVRRLRKVQGTGWMETLRVMENDGNVW